MCHCAADSDSVQGGNSVGQSFNGLKSGAKNFTVIFAGIL